MSEECGTTTAIASPHRRRRHLRKRRRPAASGAAVVERARRRFSPVIAATVLLTTALAAAASSPASWTSLSRRGDVRFGPSASTSGGVGGWLSTGGRYRPVGIAGRPTLWNRVPRGGDSDDTTEKDGESGGDDGKDGVEEAAGALLNQTADGLEIRASKDGITTNSEEANRSIFKIFGRGSAPATANAGARDGSAHLSSRFPISRDEMPHFASMSFLMFLFIYVFTTVRDTKDTLVVSNCGAEAIPFLKLYAVMPSAALFIVGYSKLSNALDKTTLFYVTLVPFFVFYMAFAFLLYPNRNLIHFPMAEGAVVGGGALAAATNLVRYWSFSLFFVVSELWASAGVPLLFWQCANDVTPMSQAKRFYPLFAVTGNLGPIVSGKVMSFVVSLFPNDDVGFGKTLQILALIKTAVCVAIVGIYRHVYKMAEARQTKQRFEESESTMRGIEKTGKVEITMKFEKKKEKLTLKESAKELVKSRELRALGTMVLCYNVCIELTEVLWKALLRRTYPTKSEYMKFMAGFSTTVGTVAFLLQLVASGIINVFGWKWTSMIPPTTMGVLAVAFFAAIIAGEDKVPLKEVLLIGTVQNVANKVMKYSLFDPCKEMAYIPLGPEARVKGKAAVDVLGARLGRSIGSASQQLLVFLVGNGSILNCAPYIGALYMATIIAWSDAVSVLGKLFEAEPQKVREPSPKLGPIGEAITLIKSIEDAKREKKGNKPKN